MLHSSKVSLRYFLMKFSGRYIFSLLAASMMLCGSILLWRQGDYHGSPTSVTSGSPYRAVIAHEYSKKRTSVTREPALAESAPKSIPEEPSPLDQPSIEELRSFPGAVVVEAAEIEGPEPGQKTRLRILKTHFKDPFIRTEEVVDSTTGAVEAREEMVANHLLVTLPEGEDPKMFLQNFGPHANAITKISEESPIYQLTLKESSLEALPTGLALLEQTDAIAGDPNFFSHALFDVNDPGYFRQWGLWKSMGGIDAFEGWKVQNSAADIIVAVLDTGIRYTHEDLAANMWHNPVPTYGDLYGMNAVKRSLNGLPTGDPMDDDGHGTHCAGTIGAVGNNALGITGVAWKVQLMACKYLDEHGLGTDADQLVSIEYALKHGAKILSFSSGRSGGYSATLFTMFARARAAGVLVVAAAGNDHRNIDQHPQYPASYTLDNIVIVAASSWLDELWSNSNYGATTVHLAAPGAQIYSTWKESDSSYAYQSGTSMAVPFVAGALALLEEQSPLRPYKETIAHLLATTDKVPALRGKTIAGRLNLAKALAR